MTSTGASVSSSEGSDSTAGGSDTPATSEDGSGTGSATGGTSPTTGSTSPEPTSGSTSSPTATSQGETDSGGCGVPVFETDIVPILNTSCGALNNACHSRVAYQADPNKDCRGWLALENMPLGSLIPTGPDAGKPTGCPDKELYQRLLELDAWQCESFDPKQRYVVPCDPSKSYIFNKVAGPLCMLGDNMPSQAMPLGAVADPNEVAIIEAWIAAGAPREGDACGLCDEGPPPEPQDPVAEIWHPGDGETRMVNVPIPWKGVASDPQDGELMGASLVWTSDLDGEIGTGNDFQASLKTVGVHTITLTATDKDNNVGTASLTLNME